MGGEAPTQKPRRYRLGFSFGGCLFVLLLFCFTPLGIPLIWGPRLWWANRQNLSEYDRHRVRYDAIVARLSDWKFEPGQRNLFTVSVDLDPASLKPVDFATGENWSEGQSIQVWREPGNRLTVQFLTKDFGHLGQYWLYYCSYPIQVNPGEKATPIAPNWWALYNGNG